MEKDIIEIKKSDLQGLFKILTNYPQISKEQVINEMTKAFGEEALKSQDIKERIKTFEDAVNAIGEDHPLVAQYKTINSAFKEVDNNLHLFAYTRLAIIAEALTRDGDQSTQRMNIAIILGSVSTHKKSMMIWMTKIRNVAVLSVARMTLRMRMAVSSVRMRMTVLRARIRISALGLPSSLVSWQSTAVSSSSKFG